MMFCHECQDEWYRDMHGLTCPECGSDFTEIIEEGNDPRDAEMHDIHDFLAHHRGHVHDDDDDDNDSMPSLEDPSPAPPGILNSLRGASDDPDEQDISNLQFRQVGPGRFAVTGTYVRTMPASPPPPGGNHGTGLIGGVTSLLTSLIGGGRNAQQDPTGAPNADSSTQNTTGGQGTPGVASFSGTMPGGHRFTYTAGARLHPRDPNNPGPFVEPVDELQNVLVGLMAAFGEQPIHPPHPHVHHGDHVHPLSPVNPMMQLIAQMFPVGNGQFGDAVYSQEALDRIITQLMEQNASSNAPGPATQSDIENLPRKPVTMEMLGSDGRADCSICMEEVIVGEEVAFLPCTHWFHHPCIAAWLGEHDTCPHCRKGISKKAEAGEGGSGGQGGSGSRGQGQQSENQPGNQSHDQTQQQHAGNEISEDAAYHIPGSFHTHTHPTTTGGAGTSGNPYTLPSSPPAASSNPFADPHTSGAGSSATAEGDSSQGGGITDRVRRSLFGPPSR